MVAENWDPEADRSSLERQGADELEALMRQRLELDRQIEGFRREVTVMFTDLRGSTALYDEKGDVHGRLLIQQHNSILFPIIQNRGGQVLKTIGDAIMAYFEDPARAVEAACEMQRELAEYNRGRPEEEQIHIRIGINSGKALVEQEDVYGDVVNVASRLVDLCGEDQILISRNTFEAVDPYLRNLSRPHAPTRLRGKTRSLQVFEVSWEEGLSVSLPKVSGRTLDLHLSRSNSKLRVALVERGAEPTTLTRYQDQQIDVAEIAASCHEVVQILKRANRMGGGTSATLRDLERVGKRLYDQLLPQTVKKTLQESTAEHLCIQMDDQLVHVPWELLFDGKEFLCRRFSLGRLVQTSKEIKGKPRPAPLKAHLLILSDPQGDLPSAAYEGDAVQQAFGDSMRVEVWRKNGRITRKQVIDELDRADVVHFCGHADYDLSSPGESGWILSDGKLTAGYIAEHMAGGAQPFPSVVFSNACQTAKTDAWSAEEENKIFGLANAFLIAGVQHFIGTIWEVMDTPSSEFAVRLYGFLTCGESIGRAVQLTRQQMTERFGRENLIWASYMLYGDPSRGLFGVPEERPSSLPDQKEEKDLLEPAAVGSREPESLEGSALRQGRYVPSETRRIPWSALTFGLVVACVIVLAFIAGIFLVGSKYDEAYALLNAGKIEPAAELFRELSESGDRLAGTEGIAAVALASNDPTEALRLANQVVSADPDRLYANAIAAQALMMLGDFPAARKALEESVGRQTGQRWQRARMWSLLGRAWAADGEIEQARGAYQKAMEITETGGIGRAEVLADLAALERRTGRIDRAVELLTEATDLDPDSEYIRALAQSTERYQTFLASEERRQRIRELDEAIREGRADAMLTAPSDDWQSPPRTVAFLGLHPSRPLGVREGEVEVLNFELTEVLQTSGRFEVVEREGFDHLLAEHEVAVSELADRRFAIQAGRILNAHIIVVGKLIQSGTETSAPIRVIETQTSRLAGMINARSERGIPGLIAQLNEQFLPKLEEAFPVRGTILDTGEQLVTLDLGMTHGLRAGDRLFVVPREAEGVVRAASTTQPYRVAELEVTGVEMEQSKARVVSGTVEANMRVVSY
jgi:class 3 adenylate cyclase/CHAT domain-containing protein/tetratricopeptide (TPR) repeat protein